ncbi:MAG TPA: Maf family protein [Chloroflexota bacterium]|nr:Maf family protein [Chloroflexota bacterium]
MPEGYGEIRLILASASPRRRELLASLGMAFQTHSAGADESIRAGESPVQTVVRLAILKAEVSAGAFPGRFVLGADTIVVDGDTILGKPTDPSHAFAILSQLRGRSHSVISAIALISPNRSRPLACALSSDVSMRGLSDEEIRQYVASGDPMDKAGAYAIQNQTFRPAHLESGCFCSVVGLPLGQVERLLLAGGIPAPVTAGQACPYARYSPDQCLPSAASFEEPPGTCHGGNVSD